MPEIMHTGDVEVFTVKGDMYVEIAGERIPVENGDGITLTLVKTLARDRGVASFVVRDADTNAILGSNDFPRFESVRVEEYNKAASSSL